MGADHVYPQHRARAHLTRIIFDVEQIGQLVEELADLRITNWHSAHLLSVR